MKTSQKNCSDAGDFEISMFSYKKSGSSCMADGISRLLLCKVTRHRNASVSSWSLTMLYLTDKRASHENETIIECNLYKTHFLLTISQFYDEIDLRVYFRRSQVSSVANRTVDNRFPSSLDSTSVSEGAYNMRQTKSSLPLLSSLFQDGDYN